MIAKWANEITASTGCRVVIPGILFFNQNFHLFYLFIFVAKIRNLDKPRNIISLQAINEILTYAGWDLIFECCGWKSIVGFTAFDQIISLIEHLVSQDQLWLMY